MEIGKTSDCSVSLELFQGERERDSFKSFVLNSMVRQRFGRASDRKYRQEDVQEDQANRLDPTIEIFN